eukprot:TRINITY_DN15275_c0_g1_i2.p1 TRINITY_DN15275_c0_g1~~TRINITY_DN15275_c0_g1_i2.p1  ORF type:complete len:1352 (-),score=218.78 TRINITY_DN15275_c0_g1_i2:610-4410(-)
MADGREMLSMRRHATLVGAIQFDAMKQSGLQSKTFQALPMQKAANPVLKYLNVDFMDVSSSSRPMTYPRYARSELELANYPCPDGTVLAQQEIAALEISWNLNSSASEGYQFNTTQLCRPCPAGSFRRPAIRSPICQECPPNTYAWKRPEDTVGNARCKPCVKGLKCDPANFTGIHALPGYYVVQKNPTPVRRLAEEDLQKVWVLHCTPESHCLGNNTCAGHQAGNGCKLCIGGYTRRILSAPTDGEDLCYACPGAAEGVFKMTLVLLGYSILVRVILGAHWASCASLKSLEFSIVRSILCFFQMTAATLLALGFDYWNKYVAFAVKVALDPLAFLHPECMEHQSGMKVYKIKGFFALFILPICLLLTYIGIAAKLIICAHLGLYDRRSGSKEEGKKAKMAAKAKKIQRATMDDYNQEEIVQRAHVFKPGVNGIVSLHYMYENTITLHKLRDPKHRRLEKRLQFMELANIIVFLCYPMVVFNMSVGLYCDVVGDDGSSLLISDYGVRCGEDIHGAWQILASVLLPILVILIPIVPVMASASSSESSTPGEGNRFKMGVRRAFGFLNHGYAAESWYAFGIKQLFIGIFLGVCAWPDDGLRNLLMAGLLIFRAVHGAMYPHFEPWDYDILSQLDVLSVVSQLALLGLKLSEKERWSSLTSIVFAVPPTLFFFKAAWGLFNNCLLKHLCFLEDIGEFEEEEKKNEGQDASKKKSKWWTGWQMFLLDATRGLQHNSAIVLDRLTGVLKGIDELDSADKKVLARAIGTTLKRYSIAAASQSFPPGVRHQLLMAEKDACQGEDDEDGGHEGLAAGVHNGRKALLYTGFLSPAIREACYLIHNSKLRSQQSRKRFLAKRSFWQRIFRKTKQKQEKLLANALKLDFKSAKSASTVSLSEAEEEEAAAERLDQGEQLMKQFEQFKEPQVIQVHDLYAALMLCWPRILGGSSADDRTMYDTETQDHLNLRNHISKSTDTKGKQSEWGQNESFDNFLTEMYWKQTLTGKTDGDEDETDSKDAVEFSVPQEKITKSQRLQRIQGVLAKPSGKEPGDYETKKEALIRELGLNNAKDTRSYIEETRGAHVDLLEDVMEARTEVEVLRKRLKRLESDALAKGVDPLDLAMTAKEERQRIRGLSLHASSSSHEHPQQQHTSEPPAVGEVWGEGRSLQDALQDIGAMALKPAGGSTIDIPARVSDSSLDGRPAPKKKAAKPSESDDPSPMDGAIVPRLKLPEVPIGSPPTTTALMLENESKPPEDQEEGNWFDKVQEQKVYGI